MYYAIWIWLNRPNGDYFNGRNSQIGFIFHFQAISQNCSITFSLFWHEVSQGGYYCTVKIEIGLIVIFQGPKGQIWVLCYSLSI